MDEVEVTPSPRPRRRPFQVGQVLSDSFSIWFKNLIPFFVLSVIVQIPIVVFWAAIISGEIPEDELMLMILIATFGGFVLSYIATGAIAYGVFRQLSGSSAGIGECITVGLQRLLPVLGVGILAGIAIFAGFVLLIVPGIIFICMLYVAIPVAVVEKPGVFASLKRSAELTNGQKGSIFGIVLVLGFLQRIIETIVNKGTPDEPWAFWLALAIAICLGALQSVAMGVSYYRLRESKEGVSIDQLVRVFA